MAEHRNNQNVDCPGCGAPVAMFSDKCESCGRKFSPDEMATRWKENGSSRHLFGCLAMLIGILGLGYWLFVPSAEEKAAKAKLAALEQRQAKHCLSPLDGSNYYVDSYLSKRMRNPDSYEHIQTNVTDVDAQGHHEFIVNFRAENGFGGMTSGMAIGKFSNESCEVVEAKIVDMN